MLYGRIGDKNGRRVLQNGRPVTEPHIESVYRAIPGIPAKSFRELVRQALEHLEECCPETLPAALRMRHSLCDLGYALRQAHFPDSFENLKLARRRLAFEQMLLYQAALGVARGGRGSSFPMEIPENACEAFWLRLPFPPTGAQRRVLEEIAEDMRRDTAMSRMVQGDVGSGKTALAFGAICLCHGAGFQAAMMAPTEILARQHYESAKTMLEPMGISCCLLTGSTRTKERREVLAALEDGSCGAVFGTHALISEGVRYGRLGLVITDEQHRFGVNQRTMLQQKGDRQGAMPHVLVMSATPIPRSLALVLYGDLDISVVDEMPPGRKPVQTRVVPEEKRSDMYAFLRREVEQGRQAYVVCPLVEESEALEDVRSAKETFEELRKNGLSGLRVGLTWGSQPPEEKAALLHSFSAGETDVLVSTTVIEVGVNVPNATVMVIEDADRYGLSQLHQLRGRVGRGEAESWCFLVTSGRETERLQVLRKTNDGFEVARKDLELRGPGDLLGTRQSGEALNGFLLDGDVRLLDEACRCMKELRSDPALAEERQQVESRAADWMEGKSVALN